MSDKKESKGVVFRRVGGRVIPIQVKDALAGAGLGIAGVATSAAAALTAAQADLRHHALRSFAFSAGRRSDRFWRAERHMTALKAARKTEELFQRSERVGKFGTKVGQIGQVAGAALIGAGINRALNHTRLKDDPEARAAASTAGGVAAAFALKNVYEAKYFKDVKAAQAIKSALTTAIKKGLRRI